jgi:hypothetical protein
MSSIYVELRCECGKAISREGHGPTGVSVVMTLILRRAREQGWRSVRQPRGWVCDTCICVERDSSANIVQLKPAGRK